MRIELSGHYSYSRILKTIIPSILMMLAISVYSIVDGIFVSNFVGTTAFAALNLVYPVMMIVGALGIMIGTGGNALVAKIKGEGNMHHANEIFSLLIAVTIVIGIVSSTLLFIFIPKIALALGAEQGEMLKDCVIYARILLISMVAFMLQMDFQSFYMAAERPQLGTKITIICGCINIVLDALFIVVFKWGLVGAAIATMIAQFIGGIFPLYYFLTKRNKSSLRLIRFSIDYHAIIKACTNGLSEFVGNIALSIVSVCYNIQLMKYVGENGVAAYGILMYLGFIYAAFLIGYNIAISPIISYNYGAKNRPELQSLFKKSFTLMLVSGIALTLLAQTICSGVVSFFVGYDEVLYNFTVRAYRIYMLSFILCGIIIFSSALFTALNNGIVSAVAAFTRTLIFEMGAVFILPAILGIDGIWLSVNVAEILATIVSVGLILSLRKRYWA